MSGRAEKPPKLKLKVAQFYTSLSIKLFAFFIRTNDEFVSAGTAAATAASDIATDEAVRIKLELGVETLGVMIGDTMRE